MATKQAVGNMKNAERARNTEPTFGKDSAADPWRAHVSLAGLTQALHTERNVRGDNTAAPGDVAWNREWLTAAYGDRYGTAGDKSNAETSVSYPKPAERTQADWAKLKGATAGTYRPEVSDKVIQ